MKTTNKTFTFSMMRVGDIDWGEVAYEKEIGGETHTLRLTKNPNQVIIFEAVKQSSPNCIELKIRVVEDDTKAKQDTKATTKATKTTATKSKTRTTAKGRK